MRPLTTDLTRDDLRPYFCWDEDVSIAELRASLRSPDRDERLRVLGRLLREARDSDVWRFVEPQEVADALPELVRHLGRRRAFWEYVIGRWRARGLVR